MLWAVVEKYDATHSDTERANPSADIGEVVPEFRALAVTHRLNPPDTTATWHQIPDGAKHKDGHRAPGYTGTITYPISKSVANPRKNLRWPSDRRLQDHPWSRWTKASNRTQL